MNAAAADLKLRASRLDVQNLRLNRPEGVLTGTLLADFYQHRVEFDVETTANPAAMAPLLGPKAAGVMQPYRFGPQTQGQARGVIDFEQPSQTSWTAKLANAGFGYWKFVADQASADLVYTNNTFSIQDFEAEFYNGRLAGTAGVSFAQDPPLYQFRFAAENCDVQGMLDDMRGEPQDVSGWLSGHLALYGQGTDTAQLHGDGDLEIREGVLLELPLFGVFSRILDEISPGLGKTKATRAQASFKIANHHVNTEDLLVNAGAFTMDGRGDVGLDGSIDMRVEARVLRQVPLLNIAGAILGKIFEYKIGGTLSSPSYRPTRLPKEILPHED